MPKKRDIPPGVSPVGEAFIRVSQFLTNLGDPRISQREQDIYWNQADLLAAYDKDIGKLEVKLEHEQARRAASRDSLVIEVSARQIERLTAKIERLRRERHAIETQWGPQDGSP